MAEESWANFVRDSCIGYDCYAASIAYTENGELFEVAADDDKGWAHFYAEDHEEQIEGKPVVIHEATNLLEVINKGTAETGLWLGGQKYQIIRSDELEYKDDTFFVVMFAFKKKGGVLVRGPTYTVIGLYDEEKNHAKNGCVNTMLYFCHALKSY